MAKAPLPPKPSPSSNSTVLLVAGAVIVIALVAFSLSRAMQTSSATASASGAVAQPAAQPSEPSPTGTQRAGNPPSLPPPVPSQAGSGFPPAGADQLQRGMEARPTASQLAAVRRITSAELLQKLEANQVTLIDVRDADSYTARHIPGALQIPLSYIAGEVSYLPKGKPIVTYCT